MMKRWGIEGLRDVMIDEIAPGMFKMWAPIGEINRLGIGKEQTAGDDNGGLQNE